MNQEISAEEQARLLEEEKAMLKEYSDNLWSYHEDVEPRLDSKKGKERAIPQAV